MPVSKLQKDALVEFLNVAIGRAARALNLMVKEEILLSIPNVDFLQRHEVLARLNETTGGVVSAIQQTFESSFSGDAFLVFPENQSLKLVQYIIGDLIDEESMTELEQETMTEVGNVVLNACMSSLSDQLNQPIQSSIPLFLSGDPQEILFGPHPRQSDDTLVMFITVMFQMKSGQIGGYIMLVLDMDSANNFLGQIDKMLPPPNDE